MRLGGKLPGALTFLRSPRGWSAALVKFAAAGLDLREWVRARPWQDLVVVWEQLPRPGWSHDDENLARLVDIESYRLHVDYARWTTTPEEARAAARDRRRPPPVPIIEPVAARPPDVHAAAVAAYEQLVARYTPAAPRRASAGSVRGLLADIGLDPSTIRVISEQQQR